MTSMAKRRYAARLAAVQALYQIEMCDAEAGRVIAEFVDHRIADSNSDADQEFFRAVVTGGANSGALIDPLIGECLADGWSMDRLGATLRSIFRAAGYELSARLDVPAPVIIDEYVNLTARFCGERETGFVNGVLDKLARRLRNDDGARLDAAKRSAG